MSPSEAAYVAYLIAYKAFMSSSFNTQEEIDAAANTVRAASAHYRAVRDGEYVVLP